MITIKTEMFVEGINSFIAKVNNGSIAEPVEYYGLQIDPIPFFTKTDVLSTPRSCST